MRKLMSFRKDELMLNDESEGSSEGESFDSIKKSDKKFGAENAYTLVE